MGLAVLLHAAGVFGGLRESVGQAATRPTGETLLSIVNVFSCCILTWKALTTMLPAFLLGGAIATFVPPTAVLRYLGARTNQVRAYLVAAGSGVVLSLCSCNIIPLFVSIYRRGAGIGPAFTLLFAGPAINVVAMIFTIQVIGWRLGVWRAMGVPVIAILTGIGMAIIFRREDLANAEAAAQRETAQPVATEGEGRVWVLFGLLLACVVFGSWEMAGTPKLLGMAALAIVVVAFALRRFEREEVREWLGETWGLVKLVVPVLIPAVLVIGALAAFIDLKLVYGLVGPAPEGSGLWLALRPILIADVFGALMYFPILSEVAFTKAFLKLGMDVGPALALLITGPGLSLPGLFITARAVGLKKALIYELIVIVLTAAFVALFASAVGQYLCACMTGS